MRRVGMKVLTVFLLGMEGAARAENPIPSVGLPSPSVADLNAESVSTLSLPPTGPDLAALEIPDLVTDLFPPSLDPIVPALPPEPPPFFPPFPPYRPTLPPPPPVV